MARRTGSALVHDPLCPASGHLDGSICTHCELIAAARTDERQRLETPWWSEEYHRGYRQGLADATGKKGTRDA